MASRSLSELIDPMARLAGEWLRRCNSRGVAVLIYCTYRSAQEQAELYALGRTTPGRIVTNAKPGHSYHQFRRAMDAVPWEHFLDRPHEISKKLDWSPFRGKEHERQFLEDNDLIHLDTHWKVMVQEAESIGLGWSGRWETFREYVHFQYNDGLTVSQLRELEMA